MKPWRATIAQTNHEHQSPTPNSFHDSNQKWNHGLWNQLSLGIWLCCKFFLEVLLCHKERSAQSKSSSHWCWDATSRCSVFLTLCSMSKLTKMFHFWTVICQSDPWLFWVKTEASKGTTCLLGCCWDCQQMIVIISLHAQFWIKESIAMITNWIKRTTISKISSLWSEISNHWWVSLCQFWVKLHKSQHFEIKASVMH